MTKIDGSKIEIVDVVTFGAPCQDLSVAGKRMGMKHTEHGDEETTRSGLFYEAIRIIKEMRTKDEQNGRANDLIRPRYAVYENVLGALSSNGGADFQAVLEETAKVVEADAHIPESPKGGWPYAGYIVGDGYSMAWRLHDSQWWGVPQRRKRLCLVADFNGYTAMSILFNPRYGGEAERANADQAVGDSGRGSGPEVQSVSSRLSGHSEQSESEGQGSAGDTEAST